MDSVEPISRNSSNVILDAAERVSRSFRDLIAQAHPLRTISVFVRPVVYVC
jgi:hypothetical protein